MEPTQLEHVIDLLDGFSENSDIDALAAQLFPTGLERSQEKLGIQCVVHWGVTRMRIGPHRPHLVCIVLRCCSLKHNFSPTFFQDTQLTLMEFLEEYDPKDESEWRAIANLFGELIRGGLFSWQGYVQWLVTRGRLQGARRLEKVRVAQRSRPLSRSSHVPSPA